MRILPLTTAAAILAGGVSQTAPLCVREDAPDLKFGTVDGCGFVRPNAGGDGLTPPVDPIDPVDPPTDPDALQPREWRRRRLPGQGVQRRRQPRKGQEMSERTYTEAEVKALVAATLQRAAEEAEPWCGPLSRSNIVNAQSIAAQQIKARILALIDTDHAAALDAVRAQAREEALEWAATEMDTAAHIMSHHGTHLEQQAYQHGAAAIRAGKGQP